ncbi:uncharacterized protein RAG0_12165 [Rhynchosporium agropyri]|uniref:LysM domain-containing protein n=1 Tax=Rhynchosporium agropyri TaxID=914238 RepID=A0A1E1L7S2_9HELO|nr:uncharacterized protein RAG0_12165 [Rhynchosporium agropyri]
MPFFQYGLAGLAVFPVAFGAIGFQLYPLIQPAPMAEILGISVNCLKALNTTLPCDEDLFKWTVKVDDTYWSEQDVAALCVPECTASARVWTQDVALACSADWLVVGDRAVPADTLSLRFTEGIEIACLRDTKNQWCLPQSYNWTGSDVVQVDCAANPADPWCVDAGNVSSKNNRISTLYDDDLLCSECFLHMMYQRVTSEFLPDTDHSDYLVSEFQDVQSVCKTSVGPLATRVVPLYPYAWELNETAPEPTYSPKDILWTVEDEPEHVAIEIEVPEGEETDEGDEWLPVPEPNIPTNCSARAVDVRASSGEGLEACNVLATRYGVASGQLMFATNADDCYSVDFVCVPEACELLRVNTGDTCKSVALALSNSTNPVGVAQLMAWNPNVLGACDHLSEGQYICMSRPGGSWVKPPDSQVPDDSNGPVRGGPGSSNTLPIINDPSTVPADRIQEGIPKDCSRYVLANATSASCFKIAADAQITQAKLFELNPVLGTNGEHCTTAIWLGYYYCVATPTPTTTTRRSSTTSSAVATGSPKPTPQHESTVSNCNKWVKAASGNGCWQLATDAGIDISLFYLWNPVLGASGENCGTKIWPDYYYCVGISSTTTTPPATTTKPSSPPKPTVTQAGIPNNCVKFVEALSGASCWQLATDNGLELSRFYSLNPVLGKGGENCGTSIWPNYFYCVATG